MDRLIGSDLMAILQSNRLIIKYEKDEAQATFEEIGLFDVKGMVFPAYKQEGRRRDTLEILFESVEDMKTVEQHLTQFKMGQD